VVLALALPAYFAFKASQVTYVGDDFLYQQRVFAIEQTESSERTLAIFPNLAVVAPMLAMLALVEIDRSKRRRAMFVASVLLALIYGASTGGKATGIVMFSSLAVIYLARTTRPNIALLIGVAAGAIALFGVGWLVVNFTFQEVESIPDALSTLTWIVALYWLGGLVAFDAVVADPNLVPSVHFVWRFFVETANGLGAGFDIPSIHAAYVDISGDSATNVYTVYFSYYPDFGIIGVVIGLFVYGAIASFFYIRAKDGHPVFLALHGFVTSGLLLTIHSERLFLALNSLIKLGVLCFLFYYLVPTFVVASRRRALSV
jgi:oligosaccharide repeat unit polymerase